LSGYGKTNVPIKLIADVDPDTPSNSVWRPSGEQILYSKFGSYASPADTLAAQNPAAEAVFSMGGSRPIIPYGLLYLGIGIRIQFKMYKNDADVAATLFRVRMGTNSTTGSDIVAQVQTTAAAGHEVTFDVTVRVTTLGNTTVAKFTTPYVTKLFTSATKTNNGSNDVGTWFSTTANNYVAFTAIPPNITATAALINFQISLVP
jgi:hypothetical protein